MEFKYGEASYGLTYAAFQPRDFEFHWVFFCPLVHQRPLMKPMSLWNYMWNTLWGNQISSEIICHPWAKQWDWRVYKGHAYAGTLMATEEEARQREPIFRESIRPWIEDWDGMYAKYVAEAISLFEPLKAIDIKKATTIELGRHFFRFWEANRRIWEIHWETMRPTFILYGEFENTCRELLGIGADDPLFRKLLQGFDNKLLQSAREQWRLGERAVELKLEDRFKTLEAEELLSALEDSDAGRRWLGEFQEFLNLWGWRTTNPLVLHDYSWVEKPSLALVGIKQAIEAGKPCPLDEARERLAAERKEVESEVLSRVPEARRELFAKLMKAGARSGFYSEDHQIYFDPPAAALAHRVLVEFGRRYTERGILDETEDIFFLFVDEIRKPLFVGDAVDLRPLVKSRKQEFEEYLKVEPEMLIGNHPEKFGELFAKDPVLNSLGGPPRVKPELKADLYGCAASPGVAEGIARVIPSIDHLGELKPGEILVTATTGPVWTPAFGIVKAVVTDAGGELAHAMIVSREYGIPCVVGTMEATRKIKTGVRIRVDGDNYAVYILG